ncbi:LRP2-binding protein isoform X2 [Conger conger]|uniref:LRP2-binding protein isoform X2 n=1 Tax=Conger conger TaxID=82655 RepID=UPI002A5AECAD|nr:LRP2-binding protein isoform X2 [Conger conger]
MESDFETNSTENHKSGRLINAISNVYGDLTLGDKAGNGSLVEMAERFLKSRAEEGDGQAIFLLGQLYYEECLYEKAEKVFDSIKDTDPKALYQLAVMYFDGLGTIVDFSKAMAYMKRVASCDDPEATSVKQCALFNLGTAYLEGYGARPSREEAERYWLLAADDGNPSGNVKAQSSLGLFYSHPDTLDLKKAFFWHSEACGNGSLESQGALGVMHLYGLGIPKDQQSALDCLKEATERGNVYAMGHLVAFYYHRKLYANAVALGKRISEYGAEDVGAIARNTECLPEYISKGIAMAMFYYARCLQRGKGVQQNVEEAKRYFSKATQLNHEVCRELHTDVTFERM